LTDTSIVPLTPIFLADQDFATEEQLKRNVEHSHDLMFWPHALTLIADELTHAHLTLHQKLEACDKGRNGTTQRHLPLLCLHRGISGDFSDVQAPSPLLLFMDTIKSSYSTLGRLISRYCSFASLIKTESSSWSRDIIDNASRPRYLDGHQPKFYIISEVSGLLVHQRLQTLYLGTLYIERNPLGFLTQLQPL